jgi:hypothetical protein
MADIIRRIDVVPAGGGALKLRCDCGFTTGIQHQASKGPTALGYATNALEELQQHWQSPCST